MRFWKYVKDSINMPSEEKNQDNSSSSTGLEEQSNDMSNQPQQQGGNQNQSDSSSSTDSEEQSNEMNNQPQQQGSNQNQSDSSNSNSSKEQINDMNNQPQQQGSNQNQNDSSSSTDSEEQSNNMNNQSQQQGGNESQSDSSSSTDSKEQSNDMNSQSQQQGSNQNQNDSSSSTGSEEQSDEINNQSQQQGENESQSDSSSSTDSKEQSNNMNNQPQRQCGNQSQNDSSSSTGSEEQSDEINNQSQQQGENESQSDSSNSNSSKEQSNDMNNQSQQQGENESQSYSSSEEPLEKIESEINDTLTETPTDNLEERKERLQQLRDKLFDYAKKKQEEEKRSTEKSKLNGDKQEATESKEEKYELSEQTNNFINQLNELPSFENRLRGAGYSIDTNGYTEIPDSVIRTLITKFLNQRFCKKTTDLNVRSNSLEKTKGFYKWEVKDVITHLETHQITKVLTDKYGYEYAQGKNENVPLSFYFDMSGSMSSYTNILAVIAIELLHKNVKVLVGFNERVNVQIESIKGNIDVETLAKILESAGYYNGWYGISSREKFINDPRVSYKYVDKNIDNYLIGKKAEKCVVFADFDPRNEIINLSQLAQVYWFCFEDNYISTDLKNFRGFIYPVQNIKDIAEGLIKVNDKRFETLCYTDNPKTLQRKIGG